jgi:two-component system, sensor histidine kinase and response regulator
VGGMRAGESTAPSPLAIAKPVASASADLNLDEALARFGNNRALLAQQARAFIQTHGDDGQTIATFLQGGDTVGAARALHALKGVAATLGATGLSRAAAEAEAAIKSGQHPATWEHLLRAVRDKLADVLQAFEKIQPSIEAAPSAATESAVLDGWARCWRRRTWRRSN